MVTVPRLCIAAPASGHGKTTVATGLMAALRRTGQQVSGHKVGPDFIDPGYHELATGRAGRNLDPHLVGEERIVPLLLHGARDADIAVIEGVMGLFDGQLGGDGYASTAHVAGLTRSPVVLVVDISHASRSIGALVHGMLTFDPSVQIAGVILNKAGSERHAAEVRRALDPLEVELLGVLHRDDGIEAPSRHLGLVPAAERPDAARALDRLADQITDRIDLRRIVEIASAAAPLTARPWEPETAIDRPAEMTGRQRPVIAVAGGRSFTFRYTETFELLRAAGCEPVEFDPLTDPRLPDGTRGLYLGGGFPEVHAPAVGANTPLLGELRAAVAAGVPTVAECAGLLYLSRTVDGVPMVGAVDADAELTSRLTLGYRTAVTATDSVLGPAGQTVTGHEFHRTRTTPDRDPHRPAWLVDHTPAGFATATLHASYLHTHWAGFPQLATAFADAAHRCPGHRSPACQTPSGAAGSTPPLTQVSPPADLRPPDDPVPADPLRHHGDVEAGDLLDFAVNVFVGPRPEWLEEAAHRAVTESTRYPDPARAIKAVAGRHRRDPDEVLLTSGAAEAFGLLARSRPWRRPVVVHPQFTEPDVALTMAGCAPEHVVLDPDNGFTLDPALVPVDADLVVIGNPTNPTSVLHPAEAIRRLLRPGRIVAVDEAFMDSVPAESESLAATDPGGLIVIRSLTKLWSVPGLRAGYALGDRSVISRMRDLQPPWSVSTPALAVIEACTTPAADIEAARRTSLIDRWRAVLTDGLTELTVPFVPDPRAPFVLARAGRAARGQLRGAGYAVRRADTFPGLDDSWIRIAVRPPAPTRHLLAELAATKGRTS